MGYSNRESKFRLELLLVYLEYMQRVADRGNGQEITDDQKRAFFRVNAELKRLTEEDSRLRALMRNLFEVLSFTRGVEDPDLFVDEKSWNEVRSIFHFLNFVLHQPEMDENSHEGFVAIAQNELEDPILKEGYVNFVEYYLEDEASTESQLIMYLQLSLNIVVSDIDDGRIVVSILGRIADFN